VGELDQALGHLRGGHRLAQHLRRDHQRPPTGQHLRGELVELGRPQDGGCVGDVDDRVDAVQLGLEPGAGGQVHARDRASTTG
jgi:hypothetical protein